MTCRISYRLDEYIVLRLGEWIFPSLFIVEYKGVVWYIDIFFNFKKKQNNENQNHQNLMPLLPERVLKCSGWG